MQIQNSRGRSFVVETLEKLWQPTLWSLYPGVVLCCWRFNLGRNHSCRSWKQILITTYRGNRGHLKWIGMDWLILLDQSEPMVEALLPSHLKSFFSESGSRTRCAKNCSRSSCCESSESYLVRVASNETWLARPPGPSTFGSLCRLGRWMDYASRQAKATELRHADRVSAMQQLHTRLMNTY